MTTDSKLKDFSLFNERYSKSFGKNHWKKVKTIKKTQKTQLGQRWIWHDLIHHSNK